MGYEGFSLSIFEVVSEMDCFSHLGVREVHTKVHTLAAAKIGGVGVPHIITY